MALITAENVNEKLQEDEDNSDHEGVAIIDENFKKLIEMFGRFVEWQTEV